MKKTILMAMAILAVLFAVSCSPTGGGIENKTKPQGTLEAFMTAYGELISTDTPDTTYSEDTIGIHIANMLLIAYSKEHEQYIEQDQYPELTMTGEKIEYKQSPSSTVSIEISFEGKGQAQPDSTCTFDGYLTVKVNDSTYRFGIDADFNIGSVSGTIKLTDTAKEHTLTLGTGSADSAD